MAKPFVEISDAVKEMPKFMWKIGAVYLFQWYALFVYWQFSTPLFMKTMGYSISEAGSQSAAMSLNIQHNNDAYCFDLSSFNFEVWK